MLTLSRTRSLRRLALAIAAAGLLLATLSVADRSGGAVATATPADPTFDPLLDGGAAVCGPPVALQLQRRWLLAAAAKTETAPFQPQPMQAAGGEVPLYENLGTLAFTVSDARPAGAGVFRPGPAAVVRASTMPRRSARSRPRRSSTRTAPCASGARRWSSARTSTCR